jgi:membrane-bound lytic murein transglycosylase D
MRGQDDAPKGPRGRNADLAVAADGAGPGRPATTTALAGVRGDLRVARNDRVETWIGFLQGRNRDRTGPWLERSGRYAPMIRQALRERGMPEDLVYLAFIESGFSPRAYSRAQAAGIWQFIAETGRRYGLEVSSYVDERRDPLKATTAALDYLEKLHRQFGNWYLAAAAYNAGENRVARVLRERRENERGTEELFWRIAPYLPQETRDYVPLMLAAGRIGKEPEKYGFVDLEYHLPLTFETVDVQGGTRLAVVARANQVERSDVEELNPHLVRKMTPPGRVTAVRIPLGRALASAATVASPVR